LFECAGPGTEQYRRNSLPGRRRYGFPVRVYDAVVDERLRMADLLAGLTDEQLAQPSLCGR
jgi:hypothetical protein